MFCGCLGVVAIAHRTRHYPDLALGVCPRCAVAWSQASKAHAWLSGRDDVTRDDIKAIAPSP